MSSKTLAPNADAPGLTGLHVLLATTAFFGVVFLVNGYLLLAALDTHSGLVAKEPYRKGLHYNARIAADERQQALGWSDAVSADATGGIALSLTDAQGNPVTALAITGVIGRPTTARHDRSITLTERQPGHYAAATAPLETGAWLLTLEARQVDAGEPVYQQKRRLWLKP